MNTPATLRERPVNAPEPHRRHKHPNQRRAQLLTLTVWTLMVLISLAMWAAITYGVTQLW